MNAALEFAMPSSGTSLRWAEVPEWPIEAFVNATAADLERGARSCAWFGVPGGGETRLAAGLAYDADNTLAVGRSALVNGRCPALTPRHADGLLITGAVSQNMKLALEKTYAAVPPPKLVIAVGAGQTHLNFDAE